MKADQNRKLWNSKIELLSRDEMQSLQWEKIKKQIHYNYDNSLFYKKKFQEIDANPKDIQCLKDFQKIPLMNKEEHRLAQQESIDRYGNPYEFIACAPIEKIQRINSTSGTTGVPTLYTLTRNDVAVVNEMHARKYWRAGIRPGVVMIQALSLSMFTGGLPLSEGIQHMGACVVPVGIEGGTQRVLDFIELTKPEAIIATPSFGEYLIEKCKEHAGKPANELGLKWFFCAGEPGGGDREIRKTLADGFNSKVFDHTGGGHAFHGISCDEPADQFSGMHFVSEDHCYLEMVDPETKESIPLEDGAVGEMVYTYLEWEGGPLLRYALGDILQVFTQGCSCGMPGIRFKIIGRADDMLIVKGVNVYPQAIKSLISKFQPDVTGHFRILLNQKGHKIDPPLQIKIEHRNEISSSDLKNLDQELTNRFRDELRISSEFKWIPAGTLPREAHKTNYFEFKNR